MVQDPTGDLLDWRDWMTVAQAAPYLGVRTKALQKWLHDGMFKGLKLESGWAVSPKDVLESIMARSNH